MDYAEVLSAARLLIALAILAVASVLDIRSRRVGNNYWILMAAVGLVLLPAQLATDGEPWEYLLVIVPILAILSDVYLEGKPGTTAEKYGPLLKYSIAILSIALVLYLWGVRPYFQHLVAVPLMMMVVVGLYMVDLIRGGADAKALISLSILFPFYPAIGGIPAIDQSETFTVLFPFSFTILVNAAIIVAILVPIGFLIANAIAGDLRFPNAFLGRKMDISLVRTRNVWLMERMVDGKHVMYAKPRREDDLSNELRLLKEAGVERVWVTPKIPFMVPMLASLILSAVVGNIIGLLSAF